MARDSLISRSKCGPLRRTTAAAWPLAASVAVFCASQPASALAHKPAGGHHGAGKKHHAAAAAKHQDRAPGPRIIIGTQGTTDGNVPAPLAPEIARTKEALDLIRKRKFTDAASLVGAIDDPVAQKLVEWVFLRSSDNPAGFNRYAAFIQANPDWPGMPQLRRRAEAWLWQEHQDAATVRRFVGDQPAGMMGRLAIARVQLAEGDKTGAGDVVRSLWHSAEMSSELEGALVKSFGDQLTADDYQQRMDRRIGAKDFTGAMRAAQHLGASHVAIVKACEAAEGGSSKAKSLLEAIGSDTPDLGYRLCRLHWLIAQNQLAAAATLVTDSKSEQLKAQDTDEWWREARLLARKLLDSGDAQTAYRVVTAAAVPANPYYAAEYHFTAGWIALRFLDDPAKALLHFAHVDDGSNDPIVLARAAYWRGRAAEAANDTERMTAEYQTAATHPTAYYGQLARARLGLAEIASRATPLPTEGAQTELLHAAEILYATGELDLVLAFITDVAETNGNVATLAGLGELTARYHDAQAMLVLGKTALARGLPVDRYAFPKVGIPSYAAIAPPIDEAIVYAIARTESGFDQRDASPANAVGLMQVTPEAGRDTAKRFKVSYDWRRMVSDPVYNTQMGAAEISALFREYAGSYVMTFAGYNAGRGRVRQWVAQHGDPRDPKIDAVDWVERIPLAESRNYVERVMENLEIYAARMGASVATVEPNLHKAATLVRSRRPVLVDAIRD